MGHYSADNGGTYRSRSGTRRAWPVLGIGFAAFMLLQSAPAQTASEYQVKAAYLYNFAKSAQWPEQSLASGSSPLLIGVVAGDEEFIDTLRQTVAGKTVGTHVILVKRVSTEAEMDFCQIIFFRSSAGHKRTQAFIASLASASILLVGEDDAFLAQGGMINLVSKDGTIHFEVNRAALDRASIHLSPALLAAANPEHGSSNGPAGESRRLKFSTPAEYPEIAKRMNIRGVVQLEVLVARDGSVKDVRVIGGHPLLTEAVVKAVKGWLYEPGAKESRELVRVAFGQ